MPFEPIGAAEAGIRRSRRILALAKHKPLPQPAVRSDLRRLAVMTLVTGIDAYMHWLVYRRISKLRRAGDLPNSLSKLGIPFTEVAALADAFLAARAKGVKSRPWVQVKNAMQKQLLKQTFQSYDQVATAFAWAGIEQGWTRVADELGVQPKEIKVQLDALVYRRNLIVHECDITRASRPRHLEYNKISQEWIEQQVDWVEELVVAIEKIVVAGNP